MKIFISYRREDSADVTGRIYDRLVEKYGKVSIFKDVDSIPFGLDFREHLDNSVKVCDVFLAVIGDDWLDVKDEEGNRRIDRENDWVRIEIESALKRNIPVIPLFVRNTLSIPTSQLPESIKKLAYRNGVPIRSDPDFHNDMNRLINGINELLERKDLDIEADNKQISAPPPTSAAESSITEKEIPDKEQEIETDSKQFPPTPPATRAESIVPVKEIPDKEQKFEADDKQPVSPPLTTEIETSVPQKDVSVKVPAQKKRGSRRFWIWVIVGLISICCFISMISWIFSY